MSVNLENLEFRSLLDVKKITFKNAVFVRETARNAMFGSIFLLLEKRSEQKKKWSPGESPIDHESTFGWPRGLLHHAGHLSLERNVEGKINMRR